MRFGSIAVLGWLLWGAALAAAQEARPPTTGDFFERLALRSPDRLPRALRPDREGRPLEIVLLLDATTTMEREIASLADHLPALAQVFTAGAASESKTQVEWSVLLYRDAEAPSGLFTLLASGQSQTSLVMEKLRAVKVETPDPFPNNAIDVGLYEALANLSWKADADAEKHLLIVGDSPAYGGGSEFRRHATEKLIELAKTRGVHIHAIRPATLPIDPETAAEARRLTNLFYSALAAPTGGFQIDLADQELVHSCWGRAIDVGSIDPALVDRTPAPRSAADEEKSAAAWSEFARRHARTVQEERELREALLRVATANAQPEEEQHRAEIERAVRVLAALADEGAGSAALHLHLSYAYDRLAPFGVLSAEASQCAWHAWKARQVAAQTSDLPESLAKEIEGWAKWRLDDDPQTAEALFERVIELADEANNPGSAARCHFACLRLAMRRATPSPEATRRHLEFLLKEAPHSPFSASLRSRLRPGKGGALWLHEDQLHAAY